MSKKVFVAGRNGVSVRAVIPGRWDDLLASVPRMTGLSKASVIRRGIGLALVELDLLAPTALDDLHPTKTSSRLRASKEYPHD